MPSIRWVATISGCGGFNAIQWSPVDRVAVWRIATVGPVQRGYRHAIKTRFLARWTASPTAKGKTVSSLTDASNPSLLSPEALSVVRATAPVVAEHADQITAHFYPRMFAAHPELLRVDQGNQATGEQSKALAGSVVAYAVQLIDPEAPSIDHVMRRIAFKHVSLGIGCATRM